MLLTINTKTTGKYKFKKINGRRHVVTEMVPIVGDISMNSIFYPLVEVKNSYMQLNNMIAPANHPKVNGEKTTAYHPCAINAHNIGGYVADPKMDGKKVVCNFMLDVDVAKTTENGKTLLKKIKAGDKVAVSTGLFINSFENRSGKDDYGVEYNQIGSGYSFDHVAILLNEKAAGDHAGTELVLNEELNKKVMINTLPEINNTMTGSDLRKQLNGLVAGWIVDFYIDEHKFIFETETPDGKQQYYEQEYTIDKDGNVTLSGVALEVFRKTVYTTTNSKEGLRVDKSKLITQLIANGYKGKSVEELETLTESELAKEIVKPIAVNEAKEVLTGEGFDFKGYEAFKANEDDYKSFVAKREAEKLELVKTIAENSDFTEELLKGKTVEELEILNNMTKKPTNPGNGGRPPQGTAPTGNKQEAPAICWN